MSELTTCLWFDTEGEAAARFYVDVFPNSRVNAVTPYPEGEREGQTMTVDFVVNGQKFVALNGGPQFSFTEAISFQIPCEDQQEVDRYWDALVAGGGEEGPCGWLKDKFGLSWQVVPNRLGELLSSSEPEVAQRVAQAMYAMKKIVIADLEAAAAEKQPV
ncbi:MAG TPA: VOC family protein [Propionibacteriaceae bacterium]|nr:VOC family protein [Propionibacteriaceae bacterium]